MDDLLVGVDVGTTSARAGIVTADGRMLGRAEHKFDMQRSGANHAEHDSEQIWQAVCAAVRGAMAEAGASPESVAGIGFDATCSLVVRGTNGEQVSVARSGEDRWDTVVWLDHRAMAEAEECTRTGHEVLDFVGGVMSPEMEVPKLMWLKRNLPQSWARIGLLFDLADYLSFKACGSLARSQCTTTSKWTYLAHREPGWQMDFLAQVGIEDMPARGRLSERASPVGSDLGPLTAEAAGQLGLTTRCRVGAGLIDAHAGALGVLGAFARDPDAINRHLSLIAGTSSCVMALSPEARQIGGVWGPYFGAILPGLWLNEAGQSATGALLDHIIRYHGAGGEPDAAMHRRIIERVRALRAEEDDLSPRLNVIPDFHGNRSPLADPNALGVISGLSLDADFDSLCRLYWRTSVGIALGVRHILEALDARGYAIDTLHVTGGHLKNPLLMELYADATGCTVVEPGTPDATLLGMAMVAATAAGRYDDLASACEAMQQGGTERRSDRARAGRYERDYRVFLAMQKHRREIDALVAED